jgi:NitT/TauT family transport system substrate-binding protein
MLGRVLCAVAAVAIGAGAARAEVEEIAAAQQFGVAFLPMMLMERDALVEKHARAAGLAKLKVDWPRVAGPSVMNDGLLSGTMHFAALGAPSLITLWSKTRANVGVLGLAAMTSYPLSLNTRNPAVTSIKDFSDKDKIAVPSVKISTQAIMLQMASAKAWGEADYQHLDPLTVSLAHPDALLAFTNGTGGVNAHFATSPFHEEEMKIPGVRTITTNYEILGGRASALVVVATGKFRTANPKVTGAFMAAVKEAIDTINADKRAAAAAYLQLANDKRNTVDDIYAIINDPGYAYTLNPEKVFATGQFMTKIGTVKPGPATCQELFVPEIRDLPCD